MLSLTFALRQLELTAILCIAWQQFSDVSASPIDLRFKRSGTGELLIAHFTNHRANENRNNNNTPITFDQSHHQLRTSGSDEDDANDSTGSTLQQEPQKHQIRHAKTKSRSRTQHKNNQDASQTSHDSKPYKWCRHNNLINPGKLTIAKRSGIGELVLTHLMEDKPDAGVTLASSEHPFGGETTADGGATEGDGADYAAGDEASGGGAAEGEDGEVAEPLFAEKDGAEQRMNSFWYAGGLTLNLPEPVNTFATSPLVSSASSVDSASEQQFKLPQSRRSVDSEAEREQRYKLWQLANQDRKSWSRNTKNGANVVPKVPRTAS